MFEQVALQQQTEILSLDSASNVGLLSQLLNTLKSDADTHTSEQWIEKLIFELPIALLVIDSEGKVAYANQLANHWLDNPQHQTWSEVIENRFAPKADDGYEISLKDGRRMHVTTQAIQGLRGQIIAINDLTESRAYQLRKSQMERLQVLGQMMASLAHQVRTPLAAALLYAGHLTNSKISDEQRSRYTEKVLKQLNQTNQQINDMLMYAQGDELIVDEIDLVDFVELLTSSILPEDIIQLTKIEFDAAFQGNKDLLLSAFQNLVNNALEASDSEVVISLEVINSERELLFLLKDTGPGMDETALNQALNPFFTTKSQGTGLGLPVVKKIIEAHQGCFDIESEVGNGTTAKIRLPLIASNEISG